MPQKNIVHRRESWGKPRLQPHGAVTTMRNLALGYPLTQDSQIVSYTMHRVPKLPKWNRTS